VEAEGPVEEVAARVFAGVAPALPPPPEQPADLPRVSET